MSRTYKDRPRWVRANQDGHVVHNHTDAGRAVYKRQKAVDDVGNVIYDDYSYYGVVGWRYFTIEGSEVSSHTQSDYRYRYPYPVYGYRNYRQPRYETVLVGHRPVECTEDKMLTHNTSRHSDLEVLCYRTLPSYLQHVCQVRPTPKEKRYYHSSGRRRERNSLREISKTYNSGIDLEEYDYEELNTRPQFHVGYWD